MCYAKFFYKEIAVKNNYNDFYIKNNNIENNISHRRNNNLFLPWNNLVLLWL